MDILIENLFRNQQPQQLTVPGYFVRSTAPTDVEEDNPNQPDKDQPTIQDVVEQLYQNSQTHHQDLGVVIAIHGYNTGSTDPQYDGVLEGWYRPLCTYINQDLFIQKSLNSLVFLGYRWPSESLKKQNNRKNALKALPVLLGLLLYGGIALTIVALVLLIFTQSLLTVPLLMAGVFGFALILTLYLLRISVYFRDTYRATNYGVTDLVELIRQLDQGLVERKIRDTLTHDSFYESVRFELAKISSVEVSLPQALLDDIQQELGRKPDMLIREGDPKFDRFLDRLQEKAPDIDRSTFTKTIQVLLRIQRQTYRVAEEYWRRNPVKLSFIGHSMGGHVTTQVIRILSDVFDPSSVGAIGATKAQKTPSSRVGRVFTLGRLILVSPDIPLLTITSGRSNFLRSSLRRFEEAYLFSNEGDLALRIASTAANYFTFPARSRTQGYRLGNVTVHPKHVKTVKSKISASIHGILNLDELANLNNDLLEYLEINVLSQDRNQSLDTRSQQQVGQDSVASRQHDEESIANLFTYFDCTEYKDRSDYNEAARNQDHNILILDNQRSPLKFLDYARLLVAYGSFSDKKFPQQGRDVHGGYFWGKFSQLLMYRLAFVGFQGLLDSLLTAEPTDFGIAKPLPEMLRERLESVRALSSSEPIQSETIAPEFQLSPQAQQRLIALDYFSWICAQKQIQTVVSPERYRVDVLGRDRGEVREAILLEEIELKS